MDDSYPDEQDNPLEESDADPTNEAAFPIQEDVEEYLAADRGFTDGAEDSGEHIESRAARAASVHETSAEGACESESRDLASTDEAKLARKKKKQRREAERAARHKAKEEKAERKRLRKEEKRKKKREAREAKQQHQQSKQKGYRKKRRSAPENEDEGFDVSDGGGESGVIRSDDESRRKRKKKRRVEITGDEAAETVQNVVKRMVKAAELDEEAILQGRPAIEKLKLLDEVVAEISKPKWINWFLREGVCHVLASWLAPCNGTLPSLKVRHQILLLIKRLPVTVDHLHGTELGHRLIYLWKASEETDEHRGIIRTIVNQLLRPVFGIKSDYAGLAVEGPARSGAIQPADDTAVLNTAISNSYRAKIPVNYGHSFKVMPKSTFVGVQQDAHRDSDSAVARLNRIVSSRRGALTSRPANRAMNVSISNSSN